MVLRKILFVLCTVVCRAAAADFGKYVSLTAHTYSFEDAEKACRELPNVGTSRYRLASPGTLGEIGFLGTLPVGNHWIGARLKRAAGAVGAWVWTHDTTRISIGANNWVGGVEPDSSLGAPECASLASDRTWVGIVCSTARFALCELAPASTAKYVALSSRDVTFEEAAAECHALPSGISGASYRLVEPRSPALIEEVRALINIGLADFWIGAIKSSTTTTLPYWFSTRTRVMFQDWEENEPDNLNDNENCVQLNSRGKWTDVPCTSRMSILCERIGPLLSARIGNYLPLNNRTYTFAEAEAACRQLAPNGTARYRLATPNTLFDLNSIQPIGLGNFWIGARRTKPEGVFIWIHDTTQLAHGETNWLGGNEPSSPGPTDADCVGVMNSTFTWSNVSCSTPMFALCELVPLPTAKYVLRSHLAFSWPNAVPTCQALSGGLPSSFYRLAEPRSKAELDEINSLSNIGLVDMWTGAVQLFRPSDQEWYYVSNGNLVPSIVMNWQPGQPDNAGGVEDCAQILADSGDWNDALCSRTFSALCERVGPPTAAPTRSPTNPSAVPTRSPTTIPTSPPSRLPSRSPTRSPSKSTNSPTTQFPTSSPGSSGSEPSTAENSGGQSTETKIIVGFVITLVVLCSLFSGFRSGCLSLNCCEKRRQDLADQGTQISDIAPIVAASNPGFQSAADIPPATLALPKYHEADIPMAVVISDLDAYSRV